MDREKVRQQLFEILEKMMLCAKSEMFEELQMLNRDSFSPLETKFFGKKLNVSQESKLFDLARNNIINMCNGYHELTPKQFLERARAKINEIKELIHNKKILMIKLLKQARKLAEQGRFDEVNIILIESFGKLEAAVFGSLRLSLIARKFDLARNAVNSMCYFTIENKEFIAGNEALRKTVEDAIDKAKKNFLKLIAQLEHELMK